MTTLEEPNQEFVGVLKELVTKLTTNKDGAEMPEITQRFSELATHNQFIPSLMSLICNDGDVQIRQVSALLLRRKLNKSWKSFPDESKNIMRQALLNQLTNERENIVTRALMQVIGVTARIEFSLSRPWDEMMGLIATTCKGSDPNAVQLGVELLSVVCETACDHLTEQYLPILALCNDILSTPGLNVETAVHAVTAFKALVPALNNQHLQLVRQLIPKTVEVTKLVLKVDEARASDIMETFECLVETKIPFVTPFIKDIVLFSLETTKMEDLEEDTRVRSLSLLQYIISCKKKAIMKHNLIGDILKVIWPIILESSDEDDDVGFIGDESDSQSPFSSCLQVVDEMALHLPPDKLFENMLPLIQNCSESQQDSHRRGLLLTLACLTEGTSEYIKDNHMRPFVTFACQGAASDDEQTRNAAMFAIGQFAEFLEPEICSYASEVMPILFAALQKVTNCKGMGISRAYYALESFVENLDKELEPYLNQLMNYLTTRMRTTEDTKEKVMVVSALGALGNAAKDKLGPYMNEILALLQSCLQTLNQDLDAIQTQALDTLGVFVRTFGKDNSQLATDSCNLGIQIIERDNDDPEMRRAAFGLFSAVASVLEEHMEPYLPKVVSAMLKTITSADGVKLHFAQDEIDNHGLAFLDDDEDDVNGDDGDDGIEAFTVENEYMEEKTDACQAIGDLAKYTKHAFLQYLDTCFVELRKQIGFPYAEVRKAAIASCGQLVMTSYQVAGEMFPELLKGIYDPFCSLLAADSERIVVMSALYTWKEMVQTCGADIFKTQYQHSFQSLIENVIQVLVQGAACQDEGEDADSPQAEYDEMLIEYCGELFPVFADKVRDEFKSYFHYCIPTLLKKMNPTSSTTEKSFSVGTMAETMDKFGDGEADSLMAECLPKFVELTGDKAPEVRNNAIFAIGVFMQRCTKEAAAAVYPKSLQALSAALTKEKKRFVIDNILGAVSRMVIAHTEFVPIKQVIPVLVGHLPIQEDHDEDMTVYTCLTGIIRHPDVLSDEPFRNSIIQSLTQACSNNDISVEIRRNIELVIKQLCEEGIISPPVSQ